MPGQVHLGSVTTEAKSTCPFAPWRPSQCCAGPRRFRPPLAGCSVTVSIAAATAGQRGVAPDRGRQAALRQGHQGLLAKRKAEGKSKKEIFRCLKRYVAREVYRTLVDPREEAASGAA